jgi:hypothetical protein
LFFGPLDSGLNPAFPSAAPGGLRTKDSLFSGFSLKTGREMNILKTENKPLGAVAENEKFLFF